MITRSSNAVDTKQARHFAQSQTRATLAFNSKTLTATFTVTAITITALSLSSNRATAQSICPPQHIATLHASDGADDDLFGHSISISGNVAVIGAPFDDDNGADSGSAYIYRRDGSNWIEEAKLLPSDGAADDRFGYAVSISGDVVVIGAERDDDVTSDSGSAYIFRYDGNGTWNEEAKLLPAAGSSPNYFFGHSVFTDGFIALIGELWDNAQGQGAGSATVYRYDGANWIEEQKLIPSDAAPFLFFGQSVSIFQDLILVGACDAQQIGFSGPHSAYVFRYDGSTWIEEAKLVAFDGVPGDGFGVSVSVGDGAALVGRPWFDDNTSGPGSAYVFRYDGSEWVHEAKLTASDGNNNDEFGTTISLTGDVAAIGAKDNYGSGVNNGAGYIFSNVGGIWSEEAKVVHPDGPDFEQFGWSVSTSGNLILFGAPTGGNQRQSAVLFDITCPPVLEIFPQPLIAGMHGMFLVTGASPNTPTYLTYSLAGPGSTFVPQLNLTLDIVAPQLAGSPTMADAFGRAYWVLPIPAGAAQTNVWFQVAQYENKSEVVPTSVIP